MYGIAAVWSLTILLKPSICRQERDKFITQQTEVNIRNGCTLNEYGTEYMVSH
jgi:hypothetical protein